MHDQKSIYNIEEIIHIMNNIKTIQGILTEFLHKIAFVDIKGAVKNQSLHWYKWLNNLSKGNGACGKWLEALPTYEKFRMNPTPFRICLRHRMYLPTINFAHGTKCVCKDHPILDPYGHHLASGCFIGGHGSNTHYALVYFALWWFCDQKRREKYFCRHYSQSCIIR